MAGNCVSLSSSSPELIVAAWADGFPWWLAGYGKKRLENALYHEYHASEKLKS